MYTHWLVFLLLKISTSEILMACISTYQNGIEKAKKYIISAKTNTKNSLRL